MGFIYGPQYIKPLTYLKYENNLGPQHQDHEGNFNGVLCLHFQDLTFCFLEVFLYICLTCTITATCHFDQ